MKALTLYQPWATLVAIGAKKIETRSWSTSYRGPLAIHAGKNTKFIDGRRHENTYICGTEPFYSVLMQAGQIWKFGSLERGCVVATCELVSCKQIDELDWLPHQRGWQYGKYSWEASDREKAFGDYTIGRYMWFLANIKILAEPIPVKGAMGLWNWELQP